MPILIWSQAGISVQDLTGEYGDIGVVEMVTAGGWGYNPE
jgi:hypothetical protein